MKICLIGDFSGTPDEGMKNISYTIKKIFESRHDVVALNSRDILQPSVIIRLKKFAPEIVHYLHGPTIRSLVMLKGLQVVLGNKVKIVVSATRPYFSKYTRWAIPFLKPNLIFSQSTLFESFFKEKGCKVAFIPNGVDCEKFSSVTIEKKMEFKKKLGLPENKIVVLHVGHIKPNRKLNIFKKIQKLPSVQTVIVGGTTEKADEELKIELKKSGVKIYHEYFKDISIVYNAADLYVFPIQHCSSELPDTYNQVGAIDLPLSVLEAMACNLPIITTKFGALPRLFKPINGLHYITTEVDILAKIKNFSFESVCQNRSKVLPFDWHKIIVECEKQYGSILTDNIKKK